MNYAGHEHPTRASLLLPISLSLPHFHLTLRTGGGRSRRTAVSAESNRFHRRTESHVRPRHKTSCTQRNSFRRQDDRRRAESRRCHRAARDIRERCCQDAPRERHPHGRGSLPFLSHANPNPSRACNVQVTAATQPSFLQQAVHVDAENKRVHVLGEVNRRFVVSPDVETLLSAMELAEQPVAPELEGLIAMDTS